MSSGEKQTTGRTYARHEDLAPSSWERTSVLPVQDDWDEEKEPEGFLLEGSLPEADAAGAAHGHPAAFLHIGVSLQ
jgi:hypothetical protein